MANQNNNVEAVVATYKKGLDEYASKSGKTMGAIMGTAGALVPGLGVILGPLGGILGNWGGKTMFKVTTAIFGKKQPWSGLNGTDKGNLIDGLANEAVFEKNLTHLEVAKNYVINSLQSSKPQIVTSNASDFWSKNAWAVNHVQLAINKYNEAMNTAKEIMEKTKQSVQQYEDSKMSLLGKSAIFKIKKGENITEEEKAAVKIELDKMKSLALSQSVRAGLGRGVADAVDATKRLKTGNNAIDLKG